MDDNEPISGLDVLEESIDDALEEEGPLASVIKESLPSSSVEAAAPAAPRQTQYRDELMRQLQSTTQKLLAPKPEPKNLLEALSRQFVMPTGKSGNLLIARQERAEKEAEDDLKRREAILTILDKQARLEREQEEDLARARAVEAQAIARARTPSQRSSELERLMALLETLEENDPRVKTIKDRITLLTTRAPRSEKEPPDPDRPSSVVINRVTGVVNRDLNPIGARLGALNETRAAIANARTNPAQVPQVDRFFARLSGDSQLSQLEVQSVANAGSFPARISSQLSKFFTGVPTDLSLDDKALVLDVLEEVLAPSFNSRRNQIINQFSVASDISPEVVERIVPPRYMTAAERRRLREQTAKTPTPEAIAFLKKNPNLAPDFDKKYGAGASKKYLEQ
jgi:hypothetical protein